MARIFPYDPSRISNRVPSFGRADPRLTAGTAVDLQPAADAAMKVAQIYQQREREKVFNERDVKGREGLEEAYIKAAQNPDPAKGLEQYREMEDNAISSALSDVDDADTRNSLLDSLRRHSLANKSRLQQLGVQKQGEQLEVARELRNQELVREWARTPSSAERKMIEADMRAGFEGDPFLSPQEKELKFQQTLGRAQVEGALSLLNRGQFGAAYQQIENSEFIGEEQRLSLSKMVQAAEQSDIIQAERRERVEDRQRAEQQEQVTLGVLTAIFSGELEEDQLLDMAINREISPSQLLTLRNALERESNPETVDTNPAEYAYSLDLIDREDPSALSTIISSDGLSLTDKKRLIDDLRQRRVIGETEDIRNEKSLTRELRNLMKARAGDLSLGSLSPVENAKDEISAVREFQDKLKAARESDQPFSPSDIFDEVVGKWMTPTQIGVLTIPPDVGNSSALDLSVLFQEAEAKLGAEINGGKMTKEQASAYLSQFRSAILDRVNAARQNKD